MTTTFSYYRGEPVVLDLVIADPGAYDVSLLSLSMRMKEARFDATPGRDAVADATFDVSYIGATEDEPGYWRARLPDSASVDLAPGHYVTDGVIQQSGAVIAVTNPLFIKINESVTLR